MYSKTRLGSDQIEGALSLTPRGKRIVYLIVAVVVAAGVAIGVWSAVSHDSYATSANGCVSVTVPSSTGGRHACTTAARRPRRSAGESFAKLGPGVAGGAGRSATWRG